MTFYDKEKGFQWAWIGLTKYVWSGSSNTAQGLERFTQFAPGATVKNEFRFFFYGLPFVQNIVMVRMFLLLCSLCAAVFRPNSLSHVSSCCTTMAKEHFKWKIGWGTSVSLGDIWNLQGFLMLTKCAVVKYQCRLCSNIIKDCDNWQACISGLNVMHSQ